MCWWFNEDTDEILIKALSRNTKIRECKKGSDWCYIRCVLSQLVVVCA